MARQSDEFRPNEPVNPSARRDDAPVIERVQELSWALIDEQITADEIQLLDNLLLSGDDARDSYIGCVKLHTDLLAHYADAAGRSFPSKTPVLGFLNEAMPPYGVQPSQQ